MVCLKYNHGKIRFHLITLVTSALPMDIIGMDFIYGLLESNEGYTIVLIIIDIASCFVILCKLISKEADPVGSWFCPFGAILTSITAALSALSFPLSSFSFLFIFLLLFSPVFFLLFLLFVMLIFALFCCSYL